MEQTVNEAKVAQTGLFSFQTILRGAFAIKNYPWNNFLLLGVVQRVIKTRSLNDMALCGREKQRDREVFEGFSAGYRGQIESPVFANPFVSSTFTARKKPVE